MGAAGQPLGAGTEQRLAGTNVRPLQRQFFARVRGAGGVSSIGEGRP
jgi:hypothetical protein